LAAISASDHGSPAGIVALTQKRATSKEMEVNKNSDKWLSLGRQFHEL
jgi:DNA-binding GntR family transcriptional regulator